MIAFLFSLACFGFWILLGYAAIAILHTQRNVLQNLLLSPVVGMAITLLPVFALNRAGIPVENFAIYLSVILLIAACGVLWRLHPVIPLRQYMPFIGIFLIAALLTGWPMLLYGFEWIGYANNDMLTLSSAAQYFASHGFFAGPTVEDLIQGRDYSQTSWYLYVVGMHREGNELLLSWAAGLTGHRPDQVFMPLALALHMVMISSTGALVLQSRRFRLAAVLSCVLLSLSALSTWAVLSQLSSQVGGLSLLLGSATLWLRAYGKWNWRNRLMRSALAGVLLAAMMLYYPEMLPFLMLSYGIFWLLTLLKNKSMVGIPWIFIGLTLVFCILILNKQFVSALVHLTSAISGGTVISKAALDVLNFPYFFKPTGLAVFWGWQSISQVFLDPWASIFIATGAVLLLIAFLSAIWQTYLRCPVAIITFVMFVLMARLFIGNDGFGLFKIVLFIQPFILATIVISWLKFAKRPSLQIMPILMLGLAGGASQNDYTQSGALEVWRGPETNIRSEFDRIVGSVPSDNLLIDTSNFFLARLQALQARGKSIDFTFFDLVGWSLSPPIGMAVSAQNILNPDLMVRYYDLNKLMGEQRKSKYIPASFNLHDKQSNRTNAFDARRQPIDGDSWLVTTTGLQSIFNRRQYGASKENFVSLPLDRVSNHLCFVRSSLGSPHYIASDYDYVSFNQLDHDYFYPAGSMSAIGPHFLFQVVNPSQSIRLTLDLTSSYKHDGENIIPPASAIGSSRQAFPIVGRGSARVFSPPLTPQWIEGSPYLSVDMNAMGASLPYKETGLMKLYGSQIQIDRRRVVAFARDISLISEADYQNLSPPENLSKFPVDLAQPSLEYSGVYEDGWVSESSFFTLKQNKISQVLRVEGMIPLIHDPAFSTELTVMVDGKPVITKQLGLGEFAVTIDLPQIESKHRVDLRFSKNQRLPNGDNRLASALLKFIGFQNSKDSRDINLVKGVK